MAISTKQVELTIKAWIDGKYRHTSAMHTDGCDIFSYALPLLVQDSNSFPHTYWLIADKPSISHTTSQHYNQLVAALGQYGMRDVLDNGQPVNRVISRGGYRYDYKQVAMF